MECAAGYRRGSVSLDASDNLRENVCKPAPGDHATVEPFCKTPTDKNIRVYFIFLDHSDDLLYQDFGVGLIDNIWVFAGSITLIDYLFDYLVGAPRPC